MPAELARREKQARERIRVGNPARFRKDLEQIKSMVSHIQQRGGRVVFVRLPVSGAVREMDDQLFPRSDYWDVLAQHSGALTIFTFPSGAIAAGALQRRVIFSPPCCSAACGMERRGIL